MGLDISVYSKITRIPDESQEDGIFDVSQEDYFGTRQDVEPGPYSISENSVRHSFRAGSYSGYNGWREDLSLSIHGVMPQVIWDNPDQYTGKDFFEIINFSDCEGCFGPKISSKLYEDFVRNRDKFISIMEEKYTGSYPVIDYRTEVYNNFMKGFEISKDSGILIFS